MRFLQLNIENFGSIGKLSVDLANQGLVLITGRNEDAAKADSNGAGKSWILEAFCWCLWGQTIRKLGSIDEVVNRQVGKDCTVTLTLAEDDSEYQIIRTRKGSGGKPNDLRLYRTTSPTRGSLDISGPSLATTQQYITDLVGMNFDLFCVIMPGAGKRASEMTDREVKALLERLLQTEVLGKAHDRVKAQIKELNSDLSEKRTTRSMLERAISECDVRLGDLQEKFTSYTGKKDSAIRAIQKQRLSLQQSVESQDAIIAKADAANGKYSEANDKLLSIDRKIEFHKTNFQFSNTAYNAGKGGRNIARGIAYGESKSLNTQLDALPDGGGDCPTCHQEVPEDHIEEIRTTLGTRLQEVTATLAKLDNRDAGAAAGHKRALEELQVVTSELDTQRKLVELDLGRFKALRHASTTAQAVRSTLLQQLTGIDVAEAALDVEKNPFEGLIGSTVQEAYDKAAEASRVYAAIVQLEHKHAILAYWLDGFSPRGVRSFMLEHVTPLLNHAAAKYADLLTAGEMSVTFHTQKKQKTGKIVESFNIQVEHVHGGESYGAASAGEKSRANLVVAFALGDLASLRANKSVSFRFLDEPFESVDESGTDAIVALLNDQKERFETVFVITHLDHFKQLFPNRLSVVKRNGMTMLEGTDD